MRTSLVVAPTERTVSRLQEMLASTILVPDYGLMNIEIAAADADVQWTSEPMTVYDDVKVRDLVTESMPYSNRVVNCLVAYVMSAKLSARAALLGMDHIERFKWVFKYDLPPGRSTRLVITTLTDALVYREEPFSFSDEMLLKV